MISARVAFRLGMVTPFVARAAIPIILWKEGCSRACIGFEQINNVRNVWTVEKITYLVSCDKPFHRCFTECFVRVGNHSFRRRYISQMTIKCALCFPVGVLSSLLSGFSGIRKFTSEIVVLAPLIVGTLLGKSIKYSALRALTTYHISSTCVCRSFVGCKSRS
jgi:hypothetical protein